MPPQGGNRSPEFLCRRRGWMAFRILWMLKERFSSCLRWAWLKT